MPLLNEKSKLYNIKNLLGGLNTFDSSDDIQDIEISDVRNMVLDDGVLQNRKGSLQNISKPTGETASPFQILVATTSKGVDYMICNYGLNFYLNDFKNNQWIKLNTTYTPTTANIFYGSTSWNNGSKDDRFYFGNGVDDTMKWIMAVDTLKVATGAGDTSITLNKSTSFPASGNLIIQNGVTQVLLAYSANDTSTGIITVGTVGTVIPAGSTVTVPIQDLNPASSVPKGKVFIKSFARLFVMNSVGFENKVNFSQSSNPEVFAVTTDMTSGGSFVLYAGVGGILGAADFGSYLLIDKQDIKHQVRQNISSDNANFVFQIIPVMSGDGIGPANQATILSYMNTSYYPTVGEGIISFSPAQTGASTTSGLVLLSQRINNLVTEVLDFSIARTAGLGQKLYWSVSLPVIGTPTVINNLVLMYDLVRASLNQPQSAWTIFDNWNAVDLKPVNGILYYLSASDGAVYKAYEGYQDATAGNPTPYTSMALSKRFNLNSPATLFKAQYIYLEGFISQSTKLYINVFDNEKGALGTQSYIIDGNNKSLTSNAFSGGLGRFVNGLPLLGGIDFETIKNATQPLFFRVYLEVSQAFREHNVQLQFFTNAMGSQWGVSTITLITQPETSIETALVLGPSAVPTI